MPRVKVTIFLTHAYLTIRLPVKILFNSEVFWSYGLRFRSCFYDNKWTVRQLIIFTFYDRFEIRNKWCNKWEFVSLGGLSQFVTVSRSILCQVFNLNTVLIMVYNNKFLYFELRRMYLFVISSRSLLILFLNYFSMGQGDSPSSIYQRLF